jgi:hypothetical protein
LASSDIDRVFVGIWKVFKPAALYVGIPGACPFIYMDDLPSYQAIGFTQLDGEKGLLMITATLWK